MKITNAEKKNSKYNELNIIISNAKYLINPVPIHQVKAGDNMLEYKAIGKFSDEEASLLKESLKDAYLYINETCKLLEKPNPQSLEILEAILGDLNESNSDESNANESDVNESDSESPLNLNSLLSIIKEIRSKILSPKLVVLKENYLDTEKDHILASVEEDDSFTFTVYENFFDKDEFKDNRSGVIIHELCHLCGIEEGVDMYDLDSAECLKNIILCLNNKITLDEIQAEYARKQEVQERNDDTLTYDENQARVEKGNPNGGQWTSDGSSGGNNLFKNPYDESPLGANLNLNIPSFENFDPIKHLDSLNKSSTYIEPRTEASQNNNPFESTNPNNIKINDREYAKDSLSIGFDGEKLSVLSDDKEIYSLPAVSGREGFQTKEYQALENTGPIPEGDYILKQENYHEMGLGSSLLGYISAATNAIGLGKYGSWTGGKSAWGDKKISISTGDGTNTLGRDGFNIHGGDDPGSAGCIDLTKYNDKFMQFFRATKKDLNLKVKY